MGPTTEMSSVRLEKNELLPEWTKNAVLAYGPRKSGTTLLLNLLDGSEELFAFPTETKFKRFLGHWKSGSAAVAQYFEHSLVLSGTFPNFDSAGYAADVEKMKQLTLPGLKEILMHDASAIYRNVQAKQSRQPSMFAMKEVGGDPRLVIGLFRQHFADGKVIMIARQPRFVTRAVFNDRRRKRQKMTFREMLREAVDPIRVLHHQVQIAREDSSVCFLRYEDLVADPGKQIRRITAYLGIASSEILERPTIFGASVVVKTSSRPVDRVFVDDAKWNTGLTFREQVAIRAGEILMRIVGRLMGRRYNSYRDVQELVAR